MKTMYALHPQSSQFKNFLFNIQSYFQKNLQTIHKARNELKIIAYEDTETIVKSFARPNLLRRVIYTYLRDSKAKKSYDNSLKIQKFTPKAIGYIEFYNNGLIDNSYFISEKFNYDFTIREPLLDLNFPSRNEILQSFARFTYELHQNNILHQDYSPGNILIQKDENSFKIKIVDINRMDFKELTLKERLKNFNKLWANDDDIKTIATEYANIIDENIEECVSIAQGFNTKHKNKINIKKRLKGIKVVD